MKVKVIFSSDKGWNGGPHNNPAVIKIAEAIRGSDDGALPPAAWEAEMLANKGQIMAALKEIGITSVCVSYEGSGDSGGVENVEIKPRGKGDLAKSKKITIYSVACPWKPRGEPRPVDILEDEVSLEQALSRFSESFIDYAGYSGYEINEGGGGDVTFLVEENQVKLEHYFWQMVKEEGKENVL